MVLCFLLSPSFFAPAAVSAKNNEPGYPSDFGTSAPCNLNARCNLFSAFTYLIPAVFKIEGFSTAYMVNNLSNDGRPLALTKLHDFPSDVLPGDTTTFTMDFNYEFPDCNNQTQPPQPVSITTTINVLAIDSSADRVLFELQAPPNGFPDNFSFQLLGWNLTPNVRTNDTIYLFGHPQGDVKKGAVLTVVYAYPEFTIANVIQGAIEGGSSGSPVFDKTGNVIGDLKGGTINGCGHTPEATALINNFNSQYTNLQQFLDPDGTGQMVCDVKLTPLPVELVSFSGIAEGNKIKLSWKTASENKNFGFNIERKDAENSEWLNIGFVKGHGTSSAPNSYSFIDIPGMVNKYYYRLKQTDLNGLFVYSSQISAAPELPAKFLLEQNYPNPFNPVTEINYSLPIKGYVTIKVFDILGRETATLINENKEAGNYKVEFHADKIPSGTYIYQLQSGNFLQTKKMLLLK